MGESVKREYDLDKHMVDAVSSLLVLEDDVKISLREFDVGGMTWRRRSDGSFGAQDGCLVFCLTPDCARYWKLAVTGIGNLSGLQDVYTHRGRHFGALSSAFSLILDYQAAAIDYEGAPDAIARIHFAIDGVFRYKLRYRYIKDRISRDSEASAKRDKRDTNGREN